MFIAPLYYRIEPPLRGEAAGQKPPSDKGGFAKGAPQRKTPALLRKLVRRHHREGFTVRNNDAMQISDDPLGGEPAEKVPHLEA